MFLPRASIIGKLKKTRQIILSDGELEVMSILWKIGEGSVHQVIEELPPHRKLAYTSVSTVLRVLEKKAMVESRKEGRGHVYLPKIGREEYRDASVHRFITQIFDGAPASLVRQLVDARALSREDLLEIKKLIEEKTD